jgi:O-antigen biosynthesis protein WbqP
MIKRATDLAVSSIGLLVLSPVLCALILLIRLESHGPGLFRQERIGRDGRPFICYKLRSMFADTPNAPTHDVADKARTRLGALLRRSKLDEFPQLWNVIKGEMSLVGPRPCLPTQTELVARRRAAGILALRPGITGLAQVTGADMSDLDRITAADARYLADRSTALDLRILAATFGLGSKGRGLAS